MGARQTDLIQQAWADSGKADGYRKLHDGLLDAGQICSEKRVARLASLSGIAAQICYKRRPGRYGGNPAVVADYTLDRQFEVDLPDRNWVSFSSRPIRMGVWRWSAGLVGMVKFRRLELKGRAYMAQGFCGLCSPKGITSSRSRG